MPIRPPFTALKIRKAASGFYKGNSLEIVLVSKAVVIALVIWALVWPANANGVLGSLNNRLLEEFNVFYIVIVGLFAVFLFVIALLPQTGKKVMGRAGEAPEFSNFSWFSMMFGAGLGVGLMVFATAEPLGLWYSNPMVLSGVAAGNTEESLHAAYRWTFMHNGFHAWAVYVVTGLSLAYYAYTRDMPLTIRSALTPLFGSLMNGFLGHLVDILGVVATILGVSVTIGFGVTQFIDGLYAVAGIDWMMDLGNGAPTPSSVGLIAGLVVIMGLSILSAVSGVGRGVKYLSNLNLVLSLVLLLTFVVFGSFLFAMTTYGLAMVDYLINFLSLSFSAYGPQTPSEYAAALPPQAAPFADVLRDGASNAWGSFETFREGLTGEAAQLPEDVLKEAYAAAEPGRLFNWQSGWTTFYWAWWIAFSPFVGLFLARISRGRTVREFIVGCVIAPALVCFAWMTILGGTAIDLEMQGAAHGAILNATDTSKLFATLEVMLSGPFLSVMIVMCVLLTMTFLVTSADSGILVMNTIMSGGDEDISTKHKVVWGLILTAVIGTLLIAGKSSGGTDAIQALKSAMIIGALPFTVVMGLMCIALAKALFRDGLRERSRMTETELAE